MPLHRQKVNSIKTNRQLISSNPGPLKRQPPKIALSVMAILVVAGATVFTLAYNSQVKPNAQVAAVREKADGSVVFDKNNLKAQQEEDKNNSSESSSSASSELISTVIEEPVQKLSTKLSPSANKDENLTIAEARCSFTFSRTNPTPVIPANEAKYFWVPNTGCQDDSINLIQLVSTKPAPVYDGAEVQNLDGDTVHAIIYWSDKRSKSDVDFGEYLVPLTRFLNDGKLYFSAKDSFDTLSRTTGESYYLAGNCDGSRTGACVLWLSSKDGVKLLTPKGVAETNTGQANNLLPNQYLKLVASKAQDRPNQLALVLKKSDTVIKVIYLDISTNYTLSDTRSYDKALNSKDYNKYFR